MISWCHFSNVGQNRTTEVSNEATTVQFRLPNYLGWSSPLRLNLQSSLGTKESERVAIEGHRIRITDFAHADIPNRLASFVFPSNIEAGNARQAHGEESIFRAAGVDSLSFEESIPLASMQARSVVHTESIGPLAIAAASIFNIHRSATFLDVTVSLKDGFGHTVFVDAPIVVMNFSEIPLVVAQRGPYQNSSVLVSGSESAPFCWLSSRHSLRVRTAMGGWASLTGGWSESISFDDLALDSNGESESKVLRVHHSVRSDLVHHVVLRRFSNKTVHASYLRTILRIPSSFESLGFRSQFGVMSDESSKNVADLYESSSSSETLVVEPRFVIMNATDIDLLLFFGMISISSIVFMISG